MAVHPREINRLTKVKGKKISYQTGIPSPSEGKSGDMTIRNVKNKGIKLFIKVNSKWWSIPMYANFTQLDDMDRIIVKRLAKYDGEIGYNAQEFTFNTDVPNGGVSLATLSKMTLNSGGDIEINADGGQVTIKDDIAHHFLFDCDNTRFTIYDDDNGLDYFHIGVAANGATGISTTDGTGSAAHLTISADGDLSLNSNGEYFLKPSSGGIKIKETDDKVSETAGYGQLWVKNDSPNNLYFTDDDDNDIQLTSGLQPLGQVLVATTTISQAEMDDLHSTEKVLVAAQGSNKVIIPIKIVLFVDRDASTAQSANVHMYFSATAATTTGNVWGLFKSFMRMESGDRVMSWADTISDNIQSLTGGDNTALSVKMSGAITSGSIDSVKVVTTYYVFDNS